jgi:hypothetical protein
MNMLSCVEARRPATMLELIAILLDLDAMAPPLLSEA